MRFYVVVLILVVIVSNLDAQKQGKYSDWNKTINQSDLKKHLEILASDELEGRNTGSQGQFLAANYIAEVFRNSSLKPIVDNKTGKIYFQKIGLKKADINYISIKNKNYSFSLIDDFIMYSTLIDKNYSYETEFIGYGIESKSFNEYSNIDLKGKIAIILWGEPMINDSTYLLDNSQNPSIWSGAYGWYKKIDVAKRRGASHVLFILPDTDYEKRVKEKKDYVFIEPYLLPDQINDSIYQKKSSAFFMRESLFDELTGIKESDLVSYKKNPNEKSIEDFRESEDLTIEIEYDLDDVLAHNVLGYLECNPKTNKTVLVTAHYDHLGYDDSGIYNGADDNASGTSTVIHLAETFSNAVQNGLELNYNILFMCVSGEERGLLGSKYYADHNPVIPLEDIICNVNIDMVGRIDEDHEESPNYIYSIGSDRLSTQLKSLVEKANSESEQLNLDYAYDRLDDPNNFYKRSDHYNFAKNNIPVVFFFNGSHLDYHQTTDTIDKINFEVMEKRARLFFNVILDIAQRRNDFKLDSHKD